MDLNNTTWRKSSHSADNDGDCVELAGLWRKASRSVDNGGNCIENAEASGEPVGTLVAVRDSKDSDGPVLLVTASELHAAVHAAMDESA
jgi:hypothetical protein